MLTGDLPLWWIAILIVAAFAAGWVDAVSGGGGLIQLPVMLLALPPSLVISGLGTNKLSSMIGTSAAAATYARRSPPDPRTALPMAGAAFIGSAMGAAAATRVPPEAFRPVVAAVLLIVWVWTLLRPAMGETDNLRWGGRRRHYVVAVALGFVIGCYDGLIGPGTGAFLVFVLVWLLGYSFLRASATAKVVNLGTNIAALIVFAIAGHVLWGLGLLMGAGNLAGGVLGARTAVRRGSGFVRTVLLAVVGVLIVVLLIQSILVLR
ncbi:MAG: TSUP family transporter [Actinobacteria bacterium]|nr:TSUP family transporter [Actinomycetota bacterium]